MKELLFYNPIMWIVWFYVLCILFSYIYWYCKRHFYFKGSWKRLDKSIHWRS